MSVSNPRLFCSYINYIYFKYYFIIYYQRLNLKQQSLVMKCHGKISYTLTYLFIWIAKSLVKPMHCAKLCTLHQYQDLSLLRSSSTTRKKLCLYIFTSFREFKKSLPNTFIYGSTLMKIDVNANIMNTQIFHLIKYGLNGD